jgi:hypothetical protein
MLTIVFTFVIIDDIKNFELLTFLKDIFLVSLLIFIWNFFFKIHTKIIITDQYIVFKKFFKTYTINLEELDFCFEKLERSKYQTYNVLYLVSNNRIIERISSFDYSNYIEIKKAIKLLEYRHIKLSIFDMIRILLGAKIFISGQK